MSDKKPIHSRSSINQAIDAVRNKPYQDPDPHALKLKKQLENSVPQLVADRENISQMMQELNDTRVQIDTLLKEVQERLNMSPEQINAYIENPKNFSETEWKAIQRKKAQIDKKMKTIYLSPANQDPVLKNGTLASSTKKRKTPKAKSRWLPMS